MTEPDAANRFEALTASLIAYGHPALSPLGAGIIAALHLDIAGDSRTFARLFGIEHALVLRETVDLCEHRLIVISRRDDRTQRLWPELTDAGRRLLSTSRNETVLPPLSGTA